VRNRSNDAGEFYEVINIGDAGPRNFTGAGSGRMPCEVDDRRVNLTRPVADLSAACVARWNRIIPHKQQCNLILGVKITIDNLRFL
jgi:hypothetical protein